jgi:CelD/BcsL family acetyltransferase involved in cellulose biosynthesis
VTTTTMTLDVSVDSDESCFELPGWRELLGTDPNRHVFATPEWNRLWWEEFGGGKDLRVLTMGRGDDLVAIVPLYSKPEHERTVLRFVGGIDLTDYLGPVCSEDDREEVAETLVDWLESADLEWEEFDAHNMPVPFGFAEFLAEKVDRSGLGLIIDQEDTSAILTLPPTWDEYLASLDSKDRHELRRKRRRLGRDHPDARFRSATDDSLETDMKIFFEMHRGAEGMKGHFMRPEIATFFERIARAFMPLGWLRLDFVEIADRAVASTFGFELDDVFYLYNSAFEPDAARLSPGLMLVSELVKESIERGLKRFDFLRGPERYKYQLGSQALPLNNVRVLKVTPE